MEKQQGFVNITDKYRIDRTKQLGEGMTSHVYLGWSNKLNRQIAVKHVSAKQWNFRRSQYQREILTMRQLSVMNHPHLMKFYGCERKPSEGLYLFLEYCPQGQLKNRAQKLNQVTLIKVFRQLLEAVSFLHQQGKVHRDIKPQNIFLDSHDNVKLGDFGKTRDIQLLMTSQQCTFIYAAPQILKKQNYDERCDVWSTGAVLYQMLHGRPLFEVANCQEALFKQMQNLCKGKTKLKVPDKFTKQWILILNQMLTPNRYKRPSSTEMLQRFKVLEQGMLGKVHSLVRRDSIEPSFDGSIIEESIKIQTEINLAKVRNHLEFSLDICQKVFLPLLLELNKDALQRLSTPYKYALVFLVQGYLISIKQYLLEEIKTRKFSTNTGPVQLMELSQSSLATVNKLLNSNFNRIQSELKDHHQTMGRVVTKLSEYMNNRQAYQKLKKLPEVLEMVEEMKKKQPLRVHTDYFDTLKKIIDSEPYYLTDQAVKQLSNENLQVYMWIRMVGRSQTLFPESNEGVENFISFRLEGIKEKEKLQRLEFVLSINQLY